MWGGEAVGEGNGFDEINMLQIMGGSFLLSE